MVPIWNRIKGLFVGDAVDYEAIWDELRPRLARSRRVAWLPRCASAGERRGDSHLGGLPALEPGAEWPVCGGCRRAMPLFLQLRASDLPAGAVGMFPDGTLQLFFCIECHPWEPFSDAALVRALPADASLAPASAPEGVTVFEGRTIVDWTEVEDYTFPDETSGAVELELEDEQFDAIGEAGFPRQGDKLFGWPYWVQGPEYPECPVCGDPMTCVFQIDSNDNLDFMWGDGGLAHVLWCPRDGELALVWQCH